MRIKALSIVAAEEKPHVAKNKVQFIRGKRRGDLFLYIGILPLVILLCVTALVYMIVLPLGFLLGWL